MKSIRHICVFATILTGICTAQAQTGPINVHFGLGTATNSSSQNQIDTFNTGTPFTTPKMGGLFGDLGASLMLTKHYGIGGDFSWRTADGAYAGINYRPLFYSVDAIYQPTSTKHIDPELRLGLGGESLRFSFSQQSCNQFTGCSTSSQALDSSNHLQVHGAAAVRLYATDHLFVRPAFDLRYVNNNFQFGRNWIPEYSLGVGWSFGRGEK